MELPDYDDIGEALMRSSAVISPAELHGMACGLLIKDASTPSGKLQELVLGQIDRGDVLDSETAAVIDKLHAVTLHQLQDSELGFDLLAPDEDEPLEARISAACDWARGLIYGLAEQGVKTKECPTDTADFLQDCLTLASNEYNVDEGSDEENEQLYMELLEFLRMGTLMAQEELQPMQAAPQLH
ncbi:MAG TPA: hypothetical protein ENJ35_00155 [Gammaproteobacteria bacterium]|nr:hypothetical protein [Gammaproteobacteria bacterium]